MNAHTALDDYESLSPIEAEQALLGAIMVNNEAFLQVSDFLEPEHFSEPIHRDIYIAIAELIQAKRPATPPTLVQKLPGDPVNEETTLAEYLARMSASAVTVVGAAGLGLAVFEAWKARAAVTVVKDFDDAMARSAVDLTEIDEALDRLIEGVADVRAKTAEKLQAETYLDTINPETVSNGPQPGVPIFASAIRHVLSEDRFERGNLYGLLSSSGEGKTSLTIQQIWHAIAMGHPVMFLSFDISRDQFVMQLNAQENSVEMRRQKKRDISKEEFEKCRAVYDALYRAPFTHTHCTNEKVEKLCVHARNFCKKAARRTDLTPLIVIDHIGAITPSDPRADAGTQAGQINRALKALAIECSAAVLVLNQRNSKGDSRKNPRPIDSDLYGSQRARNDYDAIFYVYRFRKWYHKAKDILSRNDLDRVFGEHAKENAQDIAEIGAIKVRFGDDRIREEMEFEGRFTRYKDFVGDQGQML